VATALRAMCHSGRLRAVRGRSPTEPDVASAMPAMTAAAMTTTTVTAATMEAAALVETAPAKAAAAVETAVEPEPDPDANGNSVAISAIIGITRLGISVVGLVPGRGILRIIGWVGSGCAGQTGSTIESGHLAVLGRLGSGLVKPHQAIIEIAAIRGLGRCGCGTRRADGDYHGSGKESCNSAHDSLRVGDGHRINNETPPVHIPGSEKYLGANEPGAATGFGRPGNGFGARRRSRMLDGGIPEGEVAAWMMRVRREVVGLRGDKSGEMSGATR
jgi:hypothetical protein